MRDGARRIRASFSIRGVVAKLSGEIDCANVEALLRSAPEFACPEHAGLITLAAICEKGNAPSVVREMSKAAEVQRNVGARNRRRDIAKGATKADQEACIEAGI